MNPNALEATVYGVCRINVLMVAGLSHAIRHILPIRSGDSFSCNRIRVDSELLDRTKSLSYSNHLPLAWQRLLLATVFWGRTAQSVSVLANQNQENDMPIYGT
jgi:hypothetical protein